MAKRTRSGNSVSRNQGDDRRQTQQDGIHNKSPTAKLTVRIKATYATPADQSQEAISTTGQGSSTIRNSIVTTGLPAEFAQRVRFALSRSPTASPPVVANRPDSKGSKKTRKPPFDVNESHDGTTFDFGLFQLRQKNDLGQVELVRSDGKTAPDSIYIGGHPEDAKTLIEALQALETPSTPAVTLLTSQTLLKLWLFLDHASKPFETAINYIDELDRNADQDSPDGRPFKTEVGKFKGLLPAEIFLKAAIWFGVLTERFRLLGDSSHALNGKRQVRGRSAGGRGKSAKTRPRYTKWMNKLTAVVMNGGAKSIQDGCRQIADEELRQEKQFTSLSARERIKRSKSHTDYIRSRLTLHFAAEIEGLARWFH